MNALTDERFSLVEELDSDVPNFSALKAEIESGIEFSPRRVNPLANLTIEYETPESHPVPTSPRPVVPAEQPAPSDVPSVPNGPKWQSSRGPLRRAVVPSQPPREYHEPVHEPETLLGVPVAQSMGASLAPMTRSAHGVVHNGPAPDVSEAAGLSRADADGIRRLLAAPRIPRRAKSIPPVIVPQSPSAIAAATVSQSRSIRPSPARTLGATASSRRFGGVGSRLPPLPSPSHVEARANIERLLRAVDSRVSATAPAAAAGATTDGGFRGGIRTGATLDGFAVLRAAGVSHPRDAHYADVSACGYSEIVSDDLAFFTSMSAINATDNAIGLDGFASLPRLGELHLACNALTSLIVPSGAFLSLHTLNLAYNRLPLAAIAALATLPALRRLDLSHNGLRTIPSLSRGFPSLTHLALEGNALDNGIFDVLVEAPYLLEVNLNNNRIDAVPRQQLGSFARLAALGLAENKIAAAAGVAALIEFPSLQRVALWGNPLCRALRTSPDAAEVLGTLLSQRVSLLTEGPVPAKRSSREFLNDRVGQLVHCKDAEVEAVRLARWVASSHPRRPWGAKDPARARSEAIDAFVRTLVLTEAELEDAEREHAHAAAEAAAAAVADAAASAARAAQSVVVPPVLLPNLESTVPAPADPRSTFFLTSSE